MRLHHRKLLPELCQTICHGKESEPCSQDCQVCIKICLTNPFYSPPTLPQQFPPPLQPDYDNTDQGNSHKVSTYLFLALAILTAAFFVVCCHAIYTSFISRRRVSSRQQNQETRHDDDDGNDFVDEEHHHGPMVDHPIWYIRTLGLQQSIISAITVCKYKKGEGLIEGTDCAVCLSEFQEDESLRLLPKCHHAFHLPCIDTWLRSHTNCPMCRAPIVTDLASARMESNFVDSNSLENNHIQILESTENRAPDSELLNREGEEEGQLEVEGGLRVSETETTVEELTRIRPRRSASLDSSVANIHFALAKALQEESNGNSNRVLGRIDDPTASKWITTGNDLPTTSSSRGSSSFRLTRYLQGVPSSMKRSQSYNGKYLLSWYGRSQRKPNASLRSF